MRHPKGLSDANPPPDLYGVFEPDILTPEQFFAYTRSHQQKGELRLMLGVLEDAIDCFKKYAHSKDLRGHVEFLGASEWIMSTEKRWLFSFENICQEIGFNPEYLREGLKAWQARQAASQQHSTNEGGGQ